jgi:hypothetical protein
MEILPSFCSDHLITKQPECKDGRQKTTVHRFIFSLDPQSRIFPTWQGSRAPYARMLPSEAGPKGKRMQALPA